MKFLEDSIVDKEFLKEAEKAALNSTCLRAKCGTVIVKDNEIIGRGFNSPPKNLESQRRCSINKDEYDKKVTDKTCCVHAEQRAIINALKRNPGKVNGAKLYFIRLNEDGIKEFSGNPYCTICSKMAMDVGISHWILLHKEGICIYDAEEYNNLSYNYNKSSQSL